MTNLDAAAAALTERGWATFPVRDKQPLVAWREYTLGDLNDKGQDPRQWATGIGVDCSRSGLVVIDIDRPEGQGELERALGRRLDDDGTLISTTGKGRHYIYKARPDQPVRNSASKLAAGVDVRGDGGYIIVPPSVHPDGGQYRWLVKAEPVPLPDDLYALCSAEPEAPAATPSAPAPAEHGEVTDPWARRAMVEETAIVRGELEGRRNHTLYRAGLKLYSIANGGRLTDEQVTAALTDAAMANPNGPRMEPDEVAKTLESAHRNAVQVREPQQREAPAPLPLPPHAPAGAQTFATLTVDDLQSMPEPRWLLPQRLPEGQTWVYGEPGVGKTFVTLDWALSVVAGGGKVMAFLGEGVQGYAQRVLAWRQAHPRADLAGFMAVPQAPHLLDPTSVELLVNTVRDQQPDLIIVDTFARALVGGDENSAQDVGRAIDVLDRLFRTYGTSSLVVHHSQKNGNRERGSGAIRGAADAMWEVRSYSGGGMFDSMEVSCEKMKDAEEPAPWLVQLRQTGPSAVVYPSAWTD